MPAWQEALVFLAVAAASVWVVWSMVLPRRLRRALLARLGKKPGRGCDCGGN